MNNSTQKNPVGRPCKPAEIQLSEIIQFRVTPGEFSSLTAAADKRGVSLTALIRGILKGAGLV